MTPALRHSAVSSPSPAATAARLILAALSVGIIFLLDTFTMLGTAIAVLYVMPLLFIGGDLSRLRIVPWSVLCGALTIVSYTLNHGQDSHGLGADPSPVLRMGISLAANVVTTLLILRAKAIFATLRESKERYRAIFDPWPWAYGSMISAPCRPPSTPCAPAGWRICAAISRRIPIL
jgi:hypothetical protein